ncbi:MAG: DJ-1 family protein [Campylobacteraceae bacterium 4484_4]|nr:MAG: DJ-1 family protein [Campylobacteraceae bacterium 4484_4]
MASLLVPLAEGFEEIEAVTIVDVCRRGGIEVVTAALGDREVTGANGITVVANTTIDNVTSVEFDMMVLPGGIPGAEHLRDDHRVQRLLKEFDARGKEIGAICAAPIALESAGVLKEGYTCYPSYEEQIETGGFTDAQKVVESGNVLTSRGPGTAICFGLAIVRKLVGEETYTQLKAGLLADYC